MKRFKFILILILIANAVSAQSVDLKTARAVAENWFRVNENYFAGTKLRETVELNNGQSSEAIAYFVTLAPKGFILVSADKRINPVIAFSNEKEIRVDKIRNDFFFKIILDDIRIRLNALKTNKINRSAVEKNFNKWKELLNDPRKKSTLEIIGPFVESDWGQGNVNGEPLFNLFTPHNWPAGCVATAMAQALNYYKWPPRGSGEHSYYDDNTGTQSADYENTIYDWANTLDKYVDVFATGEEKNAAALLTYHTCVSVDMDFDFGGSTAETADAPYALENYFRTSSEYFSVNASNFFAMLKDDMTKYRPAILSIKASNGAGHAAVVDGYFDTNEYFHLNPGWYGDFTGWYDISDSWNMAGYTIVVGATRDILPVPMFLEPEKIDSLAIKLTWTTSKKKLVEKFELQESETYGGDWKTLSDNLTDTSFTIIKETSGTFYCRIRAMIDDEWGEYSLAEKVVFGYNPIVKFQINMSRYSEAFDSVGLRGNIPPLSGNENSEAFNGPDSEGIYSYEMEFENSDVGKTILYRYSVAESGSFNIETANREYTLTSDSLQILPPVYFNDFTSLVSENNLPESFYLKQNYPNPFGKESVSGVSQTNVEFSLAEAGFVSLTIYNSLGERVGEILNSQYLTAGVHKLNINFGTRSFAAGIYYLTLNQGNKNLIVKLLYLK